MNTKNLSKTFLFLTLLASISAANAGLKISPRNIESILRKSTNSIERVSAFSKAYGFYEKGIKDVKTYVSGEGYGPRIIELTYDHGGKVKFEIREGQLSLSEYTSEKILFGTAFRNVEVETGKYRYGVELDTEGTGYHTITEPITKVISHEYSAPAYFKVAPSYQSGPNSLKVDLVYDVTTKEVRVDSPWDSSPGTPRYATEESVTRRVSFDSKELNLRTSVENIVSVEIRQTGPSEFQMFIVSDPGAGKKLDGVAYKVKLIRTNKAGAYYNEIRSGENTIVLSDDAIPKSRVKIERKIFGLDDAQSTSTGSSKSKNLID
ncbi:MAG: hypothetical protein K2Q18_18810 [Bdellovibrionales bacterium]|nr:hypothetical protein [Bdellovibrionales bacterium]